MSKKDKKNKLKINKEELIKVLYSDGIKKMLDILEKKLKRQQRSLSHMIISIKKGESTQKNFVKQKLKVQKLYQRLTNIRIDYLNKTINSIVKTKPSFIVIEDLNISGMMKNKHLSKAVAQ